MAGFNLSFSLNERQSSSDKNHNKSLRLVLFFPFRCCFAGSLQFSLSTVKQTKLFHSISEMCFHFFSEKKSLSKTFLVECLRSGAATCNKRREFWRETHTPQWLGCAFRAEKRSAQASAHPLSQAQGGLFCVLTVFDSMLFVTERVLTKTE